MGVLLHLHLALAPLSSTMEMRIAWTGCVAVPRAESSPGLLQVICCSPAGHCAGRASLGEGAANFTLRPGERGNQFMGCLGMGQSFKGHATDRLRSSAARSWELLDARQSQPWFHVPRLPGDPHGRKAVGTTCPPLRSG